MIFIFILRINYYKNKKLYFNLIKKLIRLTLLFVYSKYV